MENKNKINKIVLAYSGGLDTSVMLRWLKERYACEVICYCADVGQGDELSGLEEKALATGGTMALPKMPVPGVGWLAYVKDTEGNILGMMQRDTGAR